MLEKIELKEYITIEKDYIVKVLFIGNKMVCYSRGETEYSIGMERFKKEFSEIPIENPELEEVEIVWFVRESSGIYDFCDKESFVKYLKEENLKQIKPKFVMEGA